LLCSCQVQNKWLECSAWLSSHFAGDFLYDKIRWYCNLFSKHAVWTQLELFHLFTSYVNMNIILFLHFNRGNALPDWCTQKLFGEGCVNWGGTKKTGTMIRNQTEVNTSFSYDVLSLLGFALSNLDPKLFSLKLVFLCRIYRLLLLLNQKHEK
jgi:hypothetical protein